MNIECSIILLLIKTLDPYRRAFSLRIIIHWENSSLTHFCGKWQHPQHSTTAIPKGRWSRMKTEEGFSAERTEYRLGGQLHGVAPSWVSPCGSKVSERKSARQGLLPVEWSSQPNSGPPWCLLWTSSFAAALEVVRFLQHFLSRKLPSQGSGSPSRTHAFLSMCLVLSQIIYKAIPDFHIHPMGSSQRYHSATAERDPLDLGVLSVPQEACFLQSTIVRIKWGEISTRYWNSGKLWANTRKHCYWLHQPLPT